MSSYVEEIIKSHTVYEFNDTRKIITDRMGPWKNQDVTLTWEGWGENKTVKLTPDEVEILFERGLTKNVVRGEDGKIYMKTVFLDIRSYNGAIVCGILAPTTLTHMRKEIINYAKKMGYISEKMKSVEMTSVKNSLLLNKYGNYSILFKWNENVIKNIEKEVLRQFTSWYFRDFNVLIVSDGVILKNLSEDNVFSRENIDIIRKYDIQLRCLDPQIDKIVLLHAIMQRACIYSPENILSEKYFDNNRIGRNISIPNKCKERIQFNEFGTNHMLCGKISYNEEYEMYNYYINVPYNEYIRELMLSTEKIIKHKYGVYVSFSPFNEGISVSSHRNVKIEREFFVLDCAIKLLHVERDFNHYQLYDAIISLLEADSSGIFVKEYFETLKMLKEVLPEKWL